MVHECSQGHTAEVESEDANIPGCGPALYASIHYADKIDRWYGSNDEYTILVNYCPGCGVELATLVVEAEAE